MSLKENEEKLFDYLEGNIPESERKDFERHLKNCPECSKALEQARTGGEMLRNIKVKDFDIDFSNVLNKQTSLIKLPENWLSQLSRIFEQINLSGLKYSFALLILGVLLVNFASSKNWFQETPQLGKLPESSIILGKLESQVGECLFKNVDSGKFIRNNSEITVGEKSKAVLRIPGVGKIFLADGGQLNIRNGKFALGKGSMFAKIEKQNPATHISFEATGNTIEVKGTSFGLKIVDGKAYVSLFEGKLALTAVNGAKGSLSTGQNASLSSSGIATSTIQDDDFILWKKITGLNLVKSPVSLKPTPVRVLPNQINNISTGASVLSASNSSPLPANPSNTDETTDMMNILNGHQPSSIASELEN
ncbi:MAG: zf-HC2 domain-containing protein [Candidatus Riflebacteria bacterium]|nr:zf-HC2 domain-containing protein [Candidatus Riflebacteria bacterium]